MNENTGNTVSELSKILEVTESTIRSWIKKGYLKAFKKDNKYIVPNEDNENFIVDQIKKKSIRRTEAYVPKGIEDYNEWHNLIDELSWLIKTVYSSKEDIKKKNFRIDKLFAQYILQNKIELNKIKNIFPPLNSLNSKLITDDLKRGWYNELSFVVPLKKSTLGLSFNDIDINEEQSNKRFSFPSWRIVSFYYAVYFYLRTITLQKEPNIRIQEHGSTIASFKYNLIPRLEKVLWKFPLDITWTPKVRIYRRNLSINKIDHLKYKYCCHPRSPYRSPSELFEKIYTIFRIKGDKLKISTKYTLFDYLHDFRIWANYLDIDNLLSLWGRGYKGFIDQNLSLILFFIGGISELGYISIHGQKKYFENLQNLYKLFALNNPDLEKDFIYTPPYQRMVIFNKLGFINNNLELRKDVDINIIELGNIINNNRKI